MMQIYKLNKCFINQYLYINNIVALWRLGARNILELPLLAASSKMETAPMAGKPDNPAMSPHAPEKNGHPSHWYTVESRGWGGREQKPLNAPHTMLLLPATPTNKRYSPKHEVPHTCASIVKPLTNRPQSLLVVYLVKLRLTSLNNIVALWRLGARNILELPLLAASSKMETAPMAGKPDNPAMSPHAKPEDLRA